VIIERYIAREVVKPLLTICGVLLIIFVGYSSGRYLTDAVNGLLPVETVVSLILLRSAIALEVLLPVALYLSVVLGLGRLYMDSEITALQACGMGVSRVFRVVFYLSLILAIVVAGLSLYGRPWAYEQSYWIKARADIDIDIENLEAGSFYESERDGQTIFVERVRRRSGRLENVFIRSEKYGLVRVTNAHEGYQEIDEASGRRHLVLLDVHVYELQRNGTRDKIGRFGQLRMRLKDPEPISVGYKRKAASTLQLADSAQLLDVAELQWRLSTPVSTLLLGFLGVLVSRAGPRRSRYGKALAAIVIYAVYYNVSAISRTWLETGFVSTFPGIWWVQALLAVLLLALLYQPRMAFRYRRNARAA